MMRAKGIIKDGIKYFWTNYYLDELYYDMPLFKNPSYTVPDEWLEEMLDDRYSALLLALPTGNNN